MTPSTRNRIRSWFPVVWTFLLAACASTTAPPPSPTGPDNGTLERPRVVRLTTTDALAFEPDQVVVRAGETIRFVIDNPGMVIHDFTVGGAAVQAQHEEDMRTFFGAPGGSDMDDHSSAVLVEPGMTSELVYTFDSPDALLIGCHIPGHWDARMRGTISIEP